MSFQDLHNRCEFSTGPILRNMAPFQGDLVHEECVFRLDKARVVFANYPLLQHDFPQLKGAALQRAHPFLGDLQGQARHAAIENIIDDWLLTHAAYISVQQASQSRVNTYIPIREQKVMAHRPYHYGRAMIFSIAYNQKWLGEAGPGGPNQQGLLDVKGLGSKPGRKPSHASHSDGLMSLAEAIREVIFQELVDKILFHHGITCRTVPSYGIIDTGFNLVLKSKEVVPSGLLVRRAHTRPKYQWAVKDPHSQEIPIEQEIELLLRRYGITSTGLDTNLSVVEKEGAMLAKYGEGEVTYSPKLEDWIREMTGFQGGRLDFEGINLQFTREVNNKPPLPQIVDFGGFWYMEDFLNPLISIVACRPLRMGPIIWPDDPRFTRPDPKHRPAPELWAKTGRIWDFTPEGTGRPQFNNDNQMLLALNLGLAFREDKMSGKQVRATMDTYLATATDRFPPGRLDGHVKEKSDLARPRL